MFYIKIFLKEPLHIPWDIFFHLLPTMSVGGKEPHFCFIFYFIFLQGASIGLARTNHALFSLVDTNLMQYTCTCTSHWQSYAVYTYDCGASLGIEQNFSMSVNTAVVAMTYLKHKTAWALWTNSAEILARVSTLQSGQVTI